MNGVIEILMSRDGLTYDEARDIYNETQEEIYDAIGNGDYDIDEILLYNLGLEPDYIFDFIF